MHFGVLASEVGTAQLFAMLEKLAPTFVEGKPVPSLADVDLSDLAADDGWGLIAGDVDGRGLIVDSSYILSGSEPDLIAHLARETGKLVIGALAETVSGSFTYVVARGDRLLRHYDQCNMAVAVAYSQGEPFACERDNPLDDLDGSGIWAMLAELGFDFDRWDSQAAKRRVMWKTDATRAMPKGPLAEAIAAHRTLHAYAEGEQPTPEIRVRGAQADGRVAWDIATATPPKKPWWRFW
jgi:hypothetical protein